jgi:hypothetical protein
MQSDYGTDNLVYLYYHVGPSDPYSTSETNARASYFGVGGIPEVDFDATIEVIGAGTTVRTTYDPIYNTRHNTAAPVVIRSKGVIQDGTDASWVTATFRAVEAMPYSPLRAQFVVYQDFSTLYPRMVRDMLPQEAIVLASPGDSVTVTRYFTVPTAQVATSRLVTFIEFTGDLNYPKTVLNAQLMPPPYAFNLASDKFAEEIDFWGDAQFHVNITNTGALADSVTLNIAWQFPPEVGPYEWIANYCDTTGACFMGPHKYFLNPGDELPITVHIQDFVGTVSGMGLATLSVTSKGDPTQTKSEMYSAFIDLPSILLVDDDNGATLETYFQSALDDSGRGYPSMVYDAKIKGRPSQTLLDSFWAVFWTTGSGNASYLTALDEAHMATYLDGGGNLYLASMDFLSSRSGVPSDFVTNYLKVSSWQSDVGGINVNGVFGDPITTGMALAISGGPVAPAKSDAIVSSVSSDVIFNSGTGVKGVKVEENDHKVVFQSFPFEAVKVVNPSPSNQRTLARRAVEWFMIPGGVEGEIGSEFRTLVLEQNFPNPFNPTTKIAFGVPYGTEHVTLTIYNVNGRAVRTLVDGALEAGPHSLVWDGRDDDGRSLSSGIYFMRLGADDVTATRKMTLLK